MEITYRIDKDILYVSINGRVDASNASDAEAKIIALKKENADKHLVIDADGLEYISSAGLRVLLGTHKKMQRVGFLRLTNVGESVMEVLEMTGFADILEIE